MNWVQRHIITELTMHPTRRYSQMRPAEIEGNLFMYHLERLAKQGYVDKTDKEYRLSTHGRSYAGVINVDTGKPRQQPKIVAMVVCKNAAGQYLLFRWQRQPFMNQISLPYGKTHYGAPILEMAERELTMKTGLTGSFERIGDIYVKAMVEDTVFNHMLAHIFVVTNLSGEAKSSVPTGECFWGNPGDFGADELTPGLMEIIEHAENSRRPFFDEITVAV